MAYVSAADVPAGSAAASKAGILALIRDAYSIKSVANEAGRAQAVVDWPTLTGAAIGVNNPVMVWRQDTDAIEVSEDGTTFVTRFSSAELNYVTRWILYNGDQQVAAFALPATCRPEGFLAAERNGTLIQIEPKHTRTFTVTTGIA